jgi:hypothetical protein
MMFKIQQRKISHAAFPRAKRDEINKLPEGVIKNDICRLWHVLLKLPSGSYLSARDSCSKYSDASIVKMTDFEMPRFIFCMASSTVNYMQRDTRLYRV